MRVLIARIRTLLRISKDALIDVVMNAPHLGIELLKIFVKRLRSANERIMALSSGREKQS